MSSSSPMLVITNVGLAAAALASPTGPWINITKFKVGSGFGYTPQATDLDINGNLLFEGTPSSYANIGDNTRNIICKLPADSGPFEFGEVALYLDTGELFAKAAFNTPQAKLSSLGTNLLSTYTFNCLIQLDKTTAVIKVTTIDPSPTFLEVDMWSDVYPPALSADPTIQTILVKELDGNGNSSLIHQADPTQWTVGTNYHFVATASVVNATTTEVIVGSAGLDAGLVSNNNRQYVIETSDGYLRSCLSMTVDPQGYKFILNPAALPIAPAGTIKIHSNVPTGGSGGGNNSGTQASLSSNNVTLSADIGGVVSSYATATTTLTITDPTGDITSTYTITKADSAGITSTLSGHTINVTHMDDTVDSGAVTFTATKAGSPDIIKVYNIVKLKAGTGGTGQSASLSKYTVFLAATSAGVVSDFSTASTKLTILSGTLDDTSNWAITKSDSAGITSTLSGSTVTVTAMDAATDVGIITINATKVGGSPITLVFSVGKIKEGATSPSQNASLSKYSVFLTEDLNGTVTNFADATSKLTILNGATDETSTWTVSKTDSGVTSTYNPATATVTVTAMPGDTGSVTFNATKAGKPPVNLVFTLGKLKAGTSAGGITIILTKDNWLLPADSAGNVATYSGAQSFARLYIGTQDDTRNWTVTKTESSGLTSTLTPFIPANGTTPDPADIYPNVQINSLAQAQDTGSVTLTFTKPGFPTATKTFGLTKAKAGSSGNSGGTRGSMTFYVPNRTSWSDTIATQTASVFGGPILNDAVMQYDLASGFSSFRVWNGSVWVPTTPVVDGSNILNGTIAGTKFASGIQPVGVVSALPSPSGYTGPKVVLLTTDGKMYRYTGSNWTAAVPSVDITGQLSDSQLAAISAAKLTGQITSTQISDGAISTPKLQAGAVTAAQIAADTITAANIAANAITAAELAAGSVVAGKIATNAITAANIVADSITGGVIAAGAISTSELAAGAVTAANIAALAITADKIAVNTITADRIATNTITAQAGVIANFAVNTLQIAGNAVTQAVAFSQDPQQEINNPVFDTTVCTANITLSGSQPLMIIGSCLLAGAHIAQAGETPDIFLDGNYWKGNGVASGASFRYEIFNNSGYFYSISQVSVAGSLATGVPLCAQLPLLPAGNYTIFMRAILRGPQPVGIRQARMLCLETKR